MQADEFPGLASHRASWRRDGAAPPGRTVAAEGARGRYDRAIRGPEDRRSTDSRGCTAARSGRSARENVGRPDAMRRYDRQNRG